MRQGAVILLEDLWKSYSDTVAVAGVTLPVEGGEFCTILGPSGSGKTTTLMMVAGFIAPTRGRILVDGVNITMLPPQKRDLGVVFQSYALFPHMTVFNNVAFPLVMRRTPTAEIRDRVKRMLEIVKLSGLESRLPRQLSGGQQQRVALARALVFEPSVLLMDEPLGALDKKLRASLQVELKHLQQRLNVTVFYVTHDQEEALTMSDKIVVMNDGRIEQVGTPEDLYERPETSFVADFVGETNLVHGVVTTMNGEVGTIEHPTGRRIDGIRTASIKQGEQACAVMRPEHLRLSRAEPRPNGEPVNIVEGRIAEITYLGEAVKYRVVVGESRPSLAQSLLVKQPASTERFVKGDQTFVAWHRMHTRLLGCEAADG
jgi:spermidine/putrescine ABC transporter ATP-binding subunit